MSFEDANARLRRMAAGLNSDPAGLSQLMLTINADPNAQSLIQVLLVVGAVAIIEAAGEGGGMA